MAETICLIRRSELEDRLQLSRSEIYRRLDDDLEFPQPVRIGRSVRWRSDEVAAYIELLSGQRR